MAVLFGLAVFVFCWVWVRPPEWDDYKLTFMATLLLAASALTLGCAARAAGRPPSA